MAENYQNFSIWLMSFSLGFLKEEYPIQPRRQLLAFSPYLQHLSLQLVDSLDDLLWAEIFNSNNLRHLVSVSLDQCHSLSGDSLQVPTHILPERGLYFLSQAVLKNK